MVPVFVTGLGLACPLGRDSQAVIQRLASLQHGLVPWNWSDELGPHPVQVAAPVPGFHFPGPRAQDWIFPAGYQPPNQLLRVLPPSGVLAHFAVEQALADAGLSPAELVDGRTGLFTAHPGSPMLMHHHLGEIAQAFGTRGNPRALLRSAPGLLTWHFVAHYGIRGSASGHLSACSSGSHALGAAMDEIRLGRQDRMLVVAGEHLTWETFLPFHSLAALSTEPNPDLACLPFDARRSGFVPGAGSTCLILESEAALTRRRARPRAQLRGWGQASDGFHPVLPQPEGDGIRRAAALALADAGLGPAQIDYINAHAPGTVAGDAAEARGILGLLDADPVRPRPPVSSTKALTGHGLCLAGLLEAALAVLVLESGCVPGQAGLQTPDPACGDLNLPRDSQFTHPQTVLHLSSGFGGTNVATVWGRA